MKRITLLFDDEHLYRQVEAAAAKEGRPIRDVVAEALSEWLRRGPALSRTERERWQTILQRADDLRRRQRVRDRETIEDALAAIRDERS